MTGGDLDPMHLAREVVAAAIAAKLTITTAESCTGGLVAGALTEIAGSSAAFERGFVTYSNEAKAEALGVDAALIAAKGAVSEEVARAMAAGALARSRASVAVSVTGVAGPGGGSAEKPVGLVHFATARHNRPSVHRRMLFDPALDRAAIRGLAVATALEMLAEAIAAPL